VYGAAGLQISWDKTYLDTSWSVFLNDVRFYGTAQYAGVRAFLKMNDRTDVPVPSIMDDVSLLESRARGALFSGCHLYAVIIFLAFLLSDVLHKWSPVGKVIGATQALWAYVPIALGGLGVSNPLILTGSFTGKPLSDGIGNLKRIVIRYPNLKADINHVINQKISTKDYSSALAAPFTVRREESVLVGGYLSRCVTNGLQKLKGTAGFINLIKIASVAHSETGHLYDALPQTINLHMLSMLYKVTPLAALQSIANKFLKANSMRWVVGARSLIRVAYAQLKNAGVVLAKWN